MNSSWKMAATATLHCLTGCAIGEVLGMIIAAAVGLSNTSSIVVSVTLAFVFGYALTMLPLLKAGMNLRHVIGLALAADTVSIAVMELSDNGFILLVPGAMDATLRSGLFWLSLGVSLIVAFLAAWPVNRYLISKGKGHAVVHSAHHHDHDM